VVLSHATFSGRSSCLRAVVSRSVCGDKGAIVLIQEESRVSDDFCAASARFAMRSSAGATCGASRLIGMGSENGDGR
jgi:hypothetical protein